MKPFYVVVFALLLSVQSATFAQKQDFQPGLMLRNNAQIRSAMFIFNAGNKTSNLLSYQKAMLERLDTDWVESIYILKGEHAINEYGDRGKDGVVVITFKEVDLISKTFQDLLKESIRQN